MLLRTGPGECCATCSYLFLVTLRGAGVRLIEFLVVNDLQTLKI